MMTAPAKDSLKSTPMTAKPKALFVLKTQLENAGDLLINDLLMREISSYVDVHVFDRGIPREFTQAMEMKDLPTAAELEGFERNKFFAFLFGFRKKPFDYLFLVPGHGAGASLKIYFKWYPAIVLLKLLKLRGVKIIRIGTSYGKLEPSQKFALSGIVNQCSFYAVRDNQSNSYNGFKFPVWPDLAFLADENYQRPKTAPVGTREDYIVLSFRVDLIGERWQGLKAQIVDIAKKKLTENPGLKVKCIAQVQRDIPAMKELAAELAAEFPGRADFHTYDLDWSTYIPTYVNARYVLTNRLHVGLTTLACGGLGVPICARDKDSKIWSLFDDAGLGELVSFFEEDDLAAHVDRIAAFDKEKIAKFHAKIAVKRAELRNNIASLFSKGTR